MSAPSRTRIAAFLLLLLCLLLSSLATAVRPFLAREVECLCQRLAAVSCCSALARGRCGLWRECRLGCRRREVEAVGAARGSVCRGRVLELCREVQCDSCRPRTTLLSRTRCCCCCARCCRRMRCAWCSGACACATGTRGRWERCRGAATALATARGPTARGARSLDLRDELAREACGARVHHAHGTRLGNDVLRRVVERQRRRKVRICHRFFFFLFLSFCPAASTAFARDRSTERSESLQPLLRSGTVVCSAAAAACAPSVSS